MPSAAPSVPFDWPNRDASFMHDDGRLAWHLQRSGSGPALLLLHGTAASTHTWRDLLPLLSDEFDVLAVDLPGHAWTSEPPSMSLDAMTEAVGHCLDTLGFVPDCVVGHSAGAAIALNLERAGYATPSTVIGINAALSPFGGPMRRLFSPMARFFASTRLMPGMLARRAGDRNAVRRVLDGTGSRLDDTGLALYQRLLQREGHLRAVLSMMAAWDLSPLVASLETIEARVLLITGAGDRAVPPSESVRLAQRFERFEAFDIAGAGHLVHEEQPDAVAREIIAFASRYRRDGRDAGQ